eukprot:81725-Hanusia_phi.AAC.1
MMRRPGDPMISRRMARISRWKRRSRFNGFQLDRLADVHCAVPSDSAPETLSRRTVFATSSTGSVSGGEHSSEWPKGQVEPERRM